MTSNVVRNTHPMDDALGAIHDRIHMQTSDGKQLFDNLPLYWDDQEVSGSGTAAAAT